MSDELKRREKRWQDEHGQSLMARSFEQAGAREVYERQFERICSALRAPSGGRILEVGYGGGQLLEQLARRRPDADLIGVDISHGPPGLRQRLDPARVGLLVGDGEYLPLSSGRFDVVIYNGALHHLPDFRRGIREALRVLKPGGQLLLYEPISTPFSRTMHHLLDIVVCAQTEYESPVDQACKDDFLQRDLQEELERAGCTYRESWHDVVAYPLTGCYAGSFLERFTTPFTVLMGLEERLLDTPVLGRALSYFCWRLLIDAQKPL